MGKSGRGFGVELVRNSKLEQIKKKQKKNESFVQK